MSDFVNVLNKRTSAEHFDSAISISASEIEELISEACQAPSAFNIQHWRFIAVTDERIRERLKATTIASNQERIANAPLVFNSWRLGRAQEAERHSRRDRGGGSSSPRSRGGMVDNGKRHVRFRSSPGSRRSNPIWFAGSDDAHACCWESRLLELSYRFQSCSGDGDSEHQRPLFARYDAHRWSSRFRE